MLLLAALPSVLDTTDRVASGISASGYIFLLSLAISVIGALAVWIVHMYRDRERGALKRELATAEEARRREQQAKEETRGLERLGVKLHTGLSDTKAVLEKMVRAIEELERTVATRIKPPRGGP